MYFNGYDCSDPLHLIIHYAIKIIAFQWHQYIRDCHQTLVLGSDYVGLIHTLLLTATVLKMHVNNSQLVYKELRLIVIIMYYIFYPNRSRVHKCLRRGSGIQHSKGNNTYVKYRRGSNTWSIII